jgi:hypothetical protein
VRLHAQIDNGIASIASDDQPVALGDERSGHERRTKSKSKDRAQRRAAFGKVGQSRLQF